MPYSTPYHHWLTTGLYFRKTVRQTFGHRGKHEGGEFQQSGDVAAAAKQVDRPRYLNPLGKPLQPCTQRRVAEEHKRYTELGLARERRCKPLQ